MSRYIAMKPLEAGRRVEILERNTAGHLVGAWVGFWNPKRGTVTLYPNVANHFANWPGGRVPQGSIVVSDRLVETQNSKLEIRKATSSVAAKAVPPSPQGEGFNAGGVQISIKFL